MNLSNSAKFLDLCDFFENITLTGSGGCLFWPKVKHVFWDLRKSSKITSVSKFKEKWKVVRIELFIGYSRGNLTCLQTTKCGSLQKNAEYLLRKLVPLR